jgi:hypothetical protein
MIALVIFAGVSFLTTSLAFTYMERRIRHIEMLMSDDLNE